MGNRKLSMEMLEKGGFLACALLLGYDTMTSIHILYAGYEYVARWCIDLTEQGVVIIVNVLL